MTEQPCSEEDYAEAQAVWRDTGCQTLRDYTHVYLKLDVTLLVDAFEAFRERIYQISQLEASHFCGIPGLTYAFCFKYSRLKLSALMDPTMYTFFEESIRGGMTFVNKHVSRYEPPSEGKMGTHLFDVDANALYTSALSVKLPHSNFQWMDDVSHITTEWMRDTWDPDGETGMTLMVDLEYPPDIQDRTLDLPLAPTPAVPSTDDMSIYMKQLWHELHGTRPYSGGEKLLLTHKPKHRYVVHHVALKYYVEQGLRITHVYKAISYHQEAYIKPYAEYHTKARSEATDKTTQMIHKLYTNALYGKTMENKRKYKKSRLVREKKFFTKYTQHPLCASLRPCRRPP